ncbi:MAG: hypothetical protein KC910_29575 [Candidatus Eremiobacteraeota bacterium]|nr:hypothetical protein [Candidatus Eremiobacteraeota bacterium]
MKCRLRECLTVFLLCLALLGYCADVECMLAGEFCHQVCHGQPGDACSQPLVSFKPAVALAVAVAVALPSDCPPRPGSQVVWIFAPAPPPAPDPNPQARQASHRGPPA